MTKSRSNAVAPAAKGQLVVGTGTDASTTLAVASTAGYLLTVDSAESTGLKWAAASATSGPAFRAFRSGSNQSISNNSMTKVQFNGEEFDTANCFDSTTNYRFTPTTAGYYQLNWNVTLTGMTGTDASQQTLLKFNGSDNSYGILGTRDITYNFTISGGSVIKYFNGSSDYAEIFTKSDQGGTVTIQNLVEYTSFSGVWIRS